MIISLKRRSRRTATSRSSACGRKSTLWRSLKLKVSGPIPPPTDPNPGLRPYLNLPDTVTDFAWDPKSDRFAIVTSSDPNLGNIGPGITIKTEVLFYQLDQGVAVPKFKLLSKSSSFLNRACPTLGGLLACLLSCPVMYLLGVMERQKNWRQRPTPRRALPTRCGGRQRDAISYSPQSGPHQSSTSSSGTWTSWRMPRRQGNGVLGCSSSEVASTMASRTSTGTHPADLSPPARVPGGIV